MGHSAYTAEKKHWSQCFNRILISMAGQIEGEPADESIVLYLAKLLIYKYNLIYKSKFWNDPFWILQFGGFFCLYTIGPPKGHAKYFKIWIHTSSYTCKLIICQLLCFLLNVKFQAYVNTIGIQIFIYLYSFTLYYIMIASFIIM